MHRAHERGQGPAGSLQQGLDIHAATAAKVFGVDIDAVDREQRSRAKAVNFGSPTGRVPSASARPRHTAGEAAAIIEDYFAQFPRSALLHGHADRLRPGAWLREDPDGQTQVPAGHHQQERHREVRGQRIAINAPMQVLRRTSSRWPWCTSTSRSPGRPSIQDAAAGCTTNWSSMCNKRRPIAYKRWYGRRWKVPWSWTYPLLLTWTWGKLARSALKRVSTGDLYPNLPRTETIPCVRAVGCSCPFYPLASWPVEDRSPQKDTLSTEDSGDGSKVQQVRQKKTKASSTASLPMETATLLKKAGAEYETGLLNDVEKVNTYTSASKQALNLGIYGADLSYASVYDHTQESMFYTSCPATWPTSSACSVPSMTRSWTAWSGTRANGTPLLTIISGVYWNVDAYLKENGRDNIAALMMAGGWSKVSTSPRRSRQRTTRRSCGSASPSKSTRWTTCSP